MSALEFHPLADIFPLVEGQDFAELMADIKTHGLHEPIVVFESKILDGRNRYRACQAAGVEPAFTAYTGDDPIAYVISLNLRRRHLDESQRAMVAAKLATLRDGQRADLVEGLPIGRASALLNVGERSVARAREVIDHGAPELAQAVERGSISVSAAADVATLPAQEQREIVARGEREILEAPRFCVLRGPSKGAPSASSDSLQPPKGMRRSACHSGIRSSWLIPPGGTNIRHLAYPATSSSITPR
jgi:ParB-like chromosome segregation protein Spo0J